MKTIVLLLAAFILRTGQLVAQNDSTTYRFGLPVTEDDTTANFPARDLAPANEMTAVPLSELPKKVLKALKRNDQYSGWNDTTVYLEKNTGIYHVPVRTEDGVTIFGLNKDGDPVTFNIVAEPPD